MEITEVNVPEGIRYLSEWKDFESHIPDSHCILAKTLTGCGGTSHFLTSKRKVIVCSPRCSLIENKKKKHPTVCFYRSMNDNASTDSDGKKTKTKRVTHEDILKYNSEVVKYIGGCYSKGIVPKVMVTYDSLGHVIDALASMKNEDLDSWTLVIDEFQVIFGDSSFKSLTEMLFLENAQKFKRTIYMSATPYLKEYLEQLDEFKSLPYIKLVWSDSMLERPVITNVTIGKRESRNSICKKIIDKMRKGETVRFGSKEIDTTEAVFYINNVSDIIRIAKTCKLKESEVNILCSKGSEDRLRKEGLTPGNFPQEGEPHKMFTFATKSVFLGVDFYSECAMSYVFADPSHTTLALDVSTDLPQILGRQRLERNPYRNEAVLFVKENSLGLDKKEFAEYVDKKKDDTNSLVENFNTQSPEIQDLLIKKYRSAMERDRYRNDYLMVVDDAKTGKPTLAFNSLYMLAELRAWQISKMDYSSQLRLIREQERAGIAGSVGTKSDNPYIHAFKKEFDDTHNTDKRIKLYSTFRHDHPELAGEIDFVSHKYSDYWDALGYDDLKALSFQESKIKDAMAEDPYIDFIIKDEIVLEVRERLEEKRYELSKVKEELNKIYQKKGIKKKAKACDVEKYLSAKTYQDSKTGKRYYQIQSKYQKNITAFPFVWRPNRPMKMTIDRFLEIIKTGKYAITKNGKEKRNLKDVISDIRKHTDHDKQGELKREWLPVACINGTFKTKHDHGIEIYSSFVALDFDGFPDKESMEKAKEDLKQHPWIYAIFKTPSGLGLKALVLHDSVNPEHHWNLMKQLMKICELPETDHSVIDLSRGQFFSYDPNLWQNSDPQAFHFVYDGSLDVPVESKEKFISVAAGKIDDTKLDDFSEKFLHFLWSNILTDDAVMEKLDRYWKSEKPEYFDVGNRHRSMLIIAGTLCKAGIPKERTLSYLVTSYPEKGDEEIRGIVDYSYDNNPWGCDRRRYKG